MQILQDLNFSRSIRWATARRALLTGTIAGALSLTMALPQTILGQDASEGPAVAAAKKDLPKAEKLFEKHVEAIGGREKIKSYKSHTTKATFAMPAMGIEANMIIKAAAPNLFFLTMEIPGMGTMKQGFDGKVAWDMNPMMGSRVLEGDELEQMKQQADFYSDLNYKDHYSKMDTVDKVQFDGRECYKVHVVGAGEMESDMYFDVETGLLRGMEATADTQMGKMTSTTRLTEYKEFGGIKQPTKTIIETFGQEQQLTVTSIEYDSVNEKDFELPEEIKAMVSEGEGEGKGEGEAETADEGGEGG